MAYSVNWLTRVITIPVTDLTLISGTRYELGMEAFLIELRRLEATEGLWAEQILDHTNSKPDFAGANYAAFDEVINGYTITFGPGPTRVDVTGSNNNVVDVLNVTGISVVPSNSTGLTNIREIRSISFLGKDGKGVCIAQTTGFDSTLYPTGSREQPCKTEANALAISDGAYRNIFVLEPLLLTQDYSAGQTFIGDNPLLIPITVGDVATYPLKDVTGCKFQDAFVQGELDTTNILWECVVGEITNANGFIYKSTFVGPVTVNANTSIEDCWISPTAIGQECTIDFDGNAVTVIISDWSAGRIRVKNMVAGSFIGMSGTGGRLIIDVANTGGTAVYAGAIDIDDTFAASVDVLKNTTTANAVWMQAKGMDLWAAHYYRRKHDKTANTITLYEADNVTPRTVFDADDTLTDITPQ